MSPERVVPELVVMAAGMGSRFGGLKQLEPVGPDGETVMDYALYDARRAGVKRVVFVIRKDIEAAFRAQVGQRYERWMEVAYAFQEMEDLPEGHAVPEGRSKPWGTGHAVLAARHEVKSPFLVINADDFYGAEAFRSLVQWLSQPVPEEACAFAMVAFRLENTLSENGSVARGLCEVTPSGQLSRVVEHAGLRRNPEGPGAVEEGPDGGLLHFSGQEPVSMNFWGFRPAFFPELGRRFRAFLETWGGHPKAEYFLPSVVDQMIQEGQAQVTVLNTPDPWFGVTYKEDKALVQQRIRALIDAGAYPASLWNDHDR
ncbi:NTP transferase domain-containing protein [Geothrix sp. PMB-07]|uniref:nucleotidyltransferase family protein n=1 Tax=Geothrix sp. PMB-07 TaxID=3068640 RepID=UPI0027409ED5|nr:NTP transferase domain-containing protein [Geothrix sp. PMB-07]WLT30674.1 NTP transferase domain-containing protein [Geothrix sp. PMB-07]